MNDIFIGKGDSAQDKNSRFVGNVFYGSKTHNNTRQNVEVNHINGKRYKGILYLKSGKISLRLK